jgi:hypothetical protein
MMRAVASSVSMTEDLQPQEGQEQPFSMSDEKGKGWDLGLGWDWDRSH